MNLSNTQIAIGTPRANDKIGRFQIVIIPMLSKLYET